MPSPVYLAVSQLSSFSFEDIVQLLASSCKASALKLLKLSCTKSLIYIHHNAAQKRIFFREGFPPTTLFKTEKKREQKTSCWAHVAKTYCPVISCGLTKSLEIYAEVS